MAAVGDLGVRAAGTRSGPSLVKLRLPATLRAPIRPLDRPRSYFSVAASESIDPEAVSVCVCEGDGEGRAARDQYHQTHDVSAAGNPLARTLPDRAPDP